MKKQDIQIALEAIYHWQRKIEKEQSKKENARFFADTNEAVKELKKLRELLEK